MSPPLPIQDSHVVDQQELDQELSRMIKEGTNIRFQDLYTFSSISVTRNRPHLDYTSLLLRLLSGKAHALKLPTRHRLITKTEKQKSM